MGIHDNELVSIGHARTKLIPVRPDGNPINPSTVWRWIRKGLEGLDGERIKLAVVYVGNRPMVTKNAIAEFFQAVTEAKLERHRRAEALAADVTDDELRAAGLLVMERTDASSLAGNVETLRALCVPADAITRRLKIPVRPVLDVVTKETDASSPAKPVSGEVAQ